MSWNRGGSHRCSASRDGEAHSGGFFRDAVSNDRQQRVAHACGSKLTGKTS